MLIPRYSIHGWIRDASLQGKVLGWHNTAQCCSALLPHSAPQICSQLQQHTHSASFSSQDYKGKKAWGAHIMLKALAHMTLPQPVEEEEKLAETREALLWTSSTPAPPQVETFQGLPVKRDSFLSHRKKQHGFRQEGRSRPPTER